MTQMPTQSPSGSPGGKKRALSKDTSTRATCAGPTAYKHSGGLISLKQSSRFARVAVAVILSSMLLTLAPVSAEFRPVANSAVATDFFENAGSAAYNAQIAQSSIYTLITADPLPLAADTSLAVSMTDDIEKTSPLGVDDMLEANVQPDDFLDDDIFDDADLLSDVGDDTFDEDDEECPELIQPEDETPDAYPPAEAEPSAEPMVAAAPATEQGTDAPPEASDDNTDATAVSVIESQYSTRSVGSDLEQAKDNSLAESEDGSNAPQASTASTGKYIWPASGNLTSPFGYRNATVGSKNHKGIDICATTGDPIYAADAGEVTFSDWSSSFGYLLEIRHDNGHKTLYAHCSSLIAGVGERVAQGQKIALMGRTGRATAVHLHFELIINGENVDPELYLP